METQRNVKHGWALLFAGALAIALAGCSTAGKSTSDTASAPEGETAGPPEPFGPPVPPPAESYGPEPVDIRPVILVFGPGAARGFAHAGVLRALTEAKIPIGAIVGTEMGALIGPLYAMNGTINRFEWALMKFKQDTFYSRSAMSFLTRSSDGKKIEEALAQVFGAQEIQDARIPIRLILELEGSGDLVLVEKGGTARAIRAALSVPGLVDAIEWDHGKARSAAAKRPYPVSEAKLVRAGPVIAVDLLGDLPRGGKSAGTEEEKNLISYMVGAQAAGSGSLEEADLVIRPDMSGVGLLDYGKRTEAAFRGSEAAKKEIERIRQLVGMPAPAEGEHP